MTNKEEMIQIFSDCHKDAYGFRPRWDYRSLSEADLSMWFDTFQDEIDRSEKIRVAREADAVISFREIVKEVQKTCSCSIVRAVGYLMDAEHANDDWGYFCYCNDLPYEFTIDSI